MQHDLALLICLRSYVSYNTREDENVLRASRACVGLTRRSCLNKDGKLTLEAGQLILFPERFMLWVTIVADRRKTVVSVYIRSLYSINKFNFVMTTALRRCCYLHCTRPNASLHGNPVSPQVHFPHLMWTNADLFAKNVFVCSRWLRSWGKTKRSEKAEKTNVLPPAGLNIQCTD